MSQLQLVELKETLIDPLLFAHNLEHTRSCMYQGLSAQKIRNRKFAGKPACRIGVADEWYKIGKKEIYLTLDRFDSYVTHVKMPKERRNECNSQLIQNPYAGQEAGIGQADIYLNSGEEYEVKAVLKCRGEGEKICEITVTTSTHCYLLLLFSQKLNLFKKKKKIVSVEFKFLKRKQKIC